MNSKLLSFFIFFLILITTSFSQVKELRNKLEDQLNEMENEKLTLRFYNALDGEPIEGAKVTINDIGEFETDFDGKILFDIPEDGMYVAKFVKPGFITSNIKFEVEATTLIFNRHSISPILPIGSIRIVLDWGADPRDLDAHFVKEGEYHISYRNMGVSNDGVAKLDRDDVTSFGPETITANSIDDNGEYLYYIHDYTNRNDSESSELSSSAASIKIFGGDNELLKIYTVPQDLQGTEWNVFKIVNGQIEMCH